MAPVETDLAYGPHPRHRLDVYASESPGPALRPLLIAFHGGGFVRGDKAALANLGRCFAAEGFVTALSNYRLAPEAPWPAGAEDVVSATRWVQQHARRFGADARRIVLLGESAGAAHVAAATLMRRFQGAVPLAIAGAVLISGPYHPRLEGLARKALGIPTPDPRNDAYFGTNADRWAAMSTVEQVDADPFPLLITFAERDLLQMQVQAGELFARLVTRHGFEPALQRIPGHDHFSQIAAIGSSDDGLASPVLAFLRSCTA